jgi:hypothetical protein
LTGWSPIGASKAPVMLVTFNSVEHVLRLRLDRDRGELVFEMVDRRRIDRGDPSLASDDADSTALCPGAPVCSPTRGWPQPLNGAKNEQRRKPPCLDGGEGVPAG